jgi:cellulose synthase/poly-beta-1,6-N-acetylglucosamine synthase-like glycosyltransferase
VDIIFIWLIGVSLGLIVYSYAIYPCVLAVLGLSKMLVRDLAYIANKSDRRVTAGSDYEPTVGIILSAYNEEMCIEERIKNLGNLDYPRDKIRFYVGSDGSADGTNEILEKINDERLVFNAYEVNRGKSSVLNDLVESADAELLVFTDANTFFEKDAVRKLVRHFSEKNVGGVIGELNLVDSQGGKNKDGLYWVYERFLKYYEAKLGALLGANGAIYAIRKDLFSPLPADTIIDDFTVMLKVSLKNYIVKYDPEAKANEEVAPSPEDEYWRRVRIGSGNYQAFGRCLELLNPKFGFLWMSYISHKVLRWYCPHLLLVTLICSFLASFSDLRYLWLLGAQIVVYLYSYLNRKNGVKSRLLNLLVFWVNMNLALGHGALKYMSGKSSGTWDSTKR